MSKFLRNLQTDFRSGCKSLQSHQQWRSVPLSSHPCQHFQSPEFLILAILPGVRWNLRVVWICISLMIKDVEHFSGASLPFRIPQLRILCLALYPIFKLDCLVFLSRTPRRMNRYNYQWWGPLESPRCQGCKGLPGPNREDISQNTQQHGRDRTWRDRLQ